MIPIEPPVNRDINDLPSPLRMKAEGIMRGLKQLGYNPVFLEGMRSEERQDWLYGYGRTFAKNKPVKTKVRHSKHSDGKAFDIGFKDKAGKLIWDASNPCWKALATLAEHWGLASGFNWRMHDCPHVEVK